MSGSAAHKSTCGRQFRRFGAGLGLASSASVWPSSNPSTCGNGLDDTADGMVDAGCACGEGATQPCFSGPANRRGVGPVDTEVPPPPGCEGPFGSFSTYDAQCCIAQGHCCQNYPQDDSVGTCIGVMQCS